MPTGRPGNFGVHSTKGPTEFKRFRPSPIQQNTPASDTTYILRSPFVTNIKRTPPRRPLENEPNLLLGLLQTTLKPLVKNNDNWARQQFVARRVPHAEQNQLILPTTLAPLVKGNDNWQRPKHVPRHQEEAQQNRLILPTTLAPLVNNNDNTQRVRVTPRHQEVAEQNRCILPTTLKPFQPFDWPAIPRPTGRVAEATQNLLLAVLAAPPATVYVFGPPTVLPRRNPVPRAQDAIGPNLLLTVLAAPQAAPFTPEEWGRPAPLLTRQAEATQNLLLTIYQTVTYHYRASTVAPRRSAPVRRPENDSPNLLLSTLSQPAAAPFKPVDWPAIPRTTGRVAEATFNLLLTTLTAPQAAPFKPLEWGRPAPLLTRQAEAMQNLLATVLPTTLAPFKPTNWEQPIVRTSRLQDTTANLLTTLLTPTRPFSPSEWQRTQGPVSTDRARETMHNATLRLAGLVTTKPFTSYDWTPNPRLRQRANLYVEPNLLLTTLFGLFPVGEPYRTFDAVDRATFDAAEHDIAFKAKTRTFNMDLQK